MLRLVFILLWLQNYLEKSVVWSQTQTFCNGGTCYSLHWDGSSFERAKQRCEANKGILTSMESEHEAESIRQLLESNVNVVPQLHRLWIGLHRKVKQCYIAEKALRGFSWISGNDHSTYSPWIREPLRTCIYERCVELVVNFTTRIQLQWNESTCYTKGNEGFICKYQMCESLNTDIGKVVYKPPLHTASQFFPHVPQGSVAIITCNNGNSVAVKCGQQPGQIKWLYSRNLESLCNNCWEITNNGFCQNGCFQTSEEDFCFCDKGFSVNLQQKKCVPEGDVENGFNVSTGTFLKVSEIAAANTVSPTVSGSASTASVSLSGPAENSTAPLPPTIRGSEPEKREARSNAPFLMYQVIIGVLALMLLVAVMVIIIRERGNRGAKKTEAKELRMETKNAPQEDEDSSGKTMIHVTNENHYVETPPASENEINVPKENGEFSVSVAQ